MDDDRREIDIEPSPAIEDVRRVDISEVLGGTEPGAGGKAKGGGRLPKERNVKSKRKKPQKAGEPAPEVAGDPLAPAAAEAALPAGSEVEGSLDPQLASEPEPEPEGELEADLDTTELPEGEVLESPVPVALIDELASATDFPTQESPLDRLEDRQLLAALFGSPEELSVARLAEILGWRRKAVEQRLPRVQKWLDQLLLPFELRLIAGGWRLVSRSEYAELLGRLRVVRRRDRLSQAALEVLSVVAYKQPVPAGEVDRIRGVSCSSILRLLLDRELVTVLGRADSPGRPLLYGTTKVFLDRFGLGALHDLPGIEAAQEGYALSEDDEPISAVDAERELGEPADFDALPPVEPPVINAVVEREESAAAATEEFPPPASGDQDSSQDPSTEPPSAKPKKRRRR